MTEKTYDFPTEVLDLPSGGKIYPKESPLSSGQITIKYMTAKEEDILASTNLIRKGIVLDKLFESIIVDNVNPNDIIIGDKNAIVLATRLLGYGADYPISFYSQKTGEQIDAVVDFNITVYNEREIITIVEELGKKLLPAFNIEILDFKSKENLSGYTITKPLITDFKFGKNDPDTNPDIN